MKPGEIRKAITEKTQVVTKDGIIFTPTSVGVNGEVVGKDSNDNTIAAHVSEIGLYNKDAKETFVDSLKQVDPAELIAKKKEENTRRIIVAIEGKESPEEVAKLLSDGYDWIELCKSVGAHNSIFEEAKSIYEFQKVKNAEKLVKQGKTGEALRNLTETEKKKLRKQLKEQYGIPENSRNYGDVPEEMKNFFKETEYLEKPKYK